MNLDARACVASDGLLRVLKHIEDSDLDPDQRVRCVREVYQSAGRLFGQDDGRWRPLFFEPLLKRAIEYARSPPPWGPEFTVAMYELMHEPDPRCPCTDGPRCREMTHGRPCDEHRRTIERRRAVVRSAEQRLLTALPADVVRAVLAPLQAYVLVGADPTTVDDAVEALNSADPTSAEAAAAWQELLAAYS